MHTIAHSSVNFDVLHLLLKVDNHNPAPDLSGDSFEIAHHNIYAQAEGSHIVSLDCLCLC